MSKFNCRELSMRHTRRASLERMPAEVAMTLTFMFNQVQVPTSVEKNQL
jgi:hypothetical protein